MHLAFSRFLRVLIPVFIGLAGLATAAVSGNFVQLLPDPARPRLYAVNSNGKTADGSILVIDTQTRVTIKEIFVGKEPTDIDLTENSAELLVMNTTDRSISRIDLTSLSVTSTRQLTDFDTHNEDFGGHVADGPGNIIYYVDEQGGPRLRVYDAVKGTVLQTLGAVTTGTGDDHGFGDIVVSPDRKTLFGWVQYGDGVGWVGSYIVRYDIAADGKLTFAGQGNYSDPTPLKREPFDSKALMTADGSQLMIKNRLVQQTNLNRFPVIYPAGIYSMSSNGSIVATSSAILSAADGASLATLPVTATVQAILPDNTAMAYFNGAAQSIEWVDLVATVGSGALGLTVSPAEGAIVTAPARLDWFPTSGISRYQVYLGTIRGDVEAATITSPLFLGETAVPTLNLIAPLLGGQNYFWRIVPEGADGSPIGTGITRSFHVSNVTLSKSSIKAETVVGVTRHVETINLQSQGAQTWTAASNVPWLTFQNISGTAPGDLVAIFNSSALKVGSYTGKITMTAGGDSFVIPVTLRVYAADFKFVEADLSLPWIYVVSESASPAGQPAFLLRINTATNLIESDVPCGRSVQDLAIHYPENRIYLTNWETGIVRAFDRGSFQQARTYQMEPGPQSGGAWRIAAGKSGRVILEGANSPAKMQLLNTASGEVIAAKDSEYGGISGGSDPTGRYYFHTGEGLMTRFDLAADTFSAVGTTTVPANGSIMMVADGLKIVVGNSIFNSQPALQFTLPSNVFGATQHGELLFSATKVYNGSNGAELATLPVSTSVKCVSGDQTKLYQFPARTNVFQVLNLSGVGGISSGVLTPGIPDGSAVVSNMPELSWSKKNEAISYNVYLGSSASAVGAATPASPEFVGNTTTTSWTGSLPPVEFGKTYWWRVDIVGFSSKVIGSIWSFKTPVVDVMPRAIELDYPSGSLIPVQRLDLTSRITVPTAGAPVPWTATTTTPWISLRNAVGSTPGLIEFEIQTAGLPAGLNSGSITVQANGDSFSVPVRLRLKALDIIKLVAHPARQVVYGISTRPGEGSPSLLVEIDAASAAVIRTMPVGWNATDADFDPIAGKIYITNFGYAETRVVDVNAWTELSPLLLGADVYQLEIASENRLLTETSEQWAQITLWNSSKVGQLATVTSIREGGGLADPTGAFYYHADSNSSGAVISKYRISNDQITMVAASPVIDYGSRNLVLNGTGSKLFWQGRVLDENLHVIGRVPSEVYATSFNGEVAVGANELWWSDSGTSAALLPFASTFAAVSAGDKSLVRFNASAKTLHAIPLASLGDFPGPSPRPGQELPTSPTRLSWSPVAGATGYQVYIAADAAALLEMTAPVATVPTNFYDLPSVLAPGQFYFWRVDAVTGAGVTTGKSQSFGVRFPEGEVLPFPVGGAQGISASISGDHLVVGSPGSAHFCVFDSVTGVTGPAQQLATPGNNFEYSFGNAVAADTGKISVGANKVNNPLDRSGAAFVFRPDEFGSWEGSEALSPPVPSHIEAFGSGLAEVGNQMLVGTGASTASAGRVAYYITEPAVERMQVFSADDGASADGFGQVIAMDGDQAIISAPGSGSIGNRSPVIYAFVRSPVTGLWKQTQRIPIPSAVAYKVAGTALAFSGNYFATNNPGAGTVEVFTKDASGLWSPSATIKQSSIAGSSSSSFGSGLAFSGDQLFIGDSAASHVGATGGAVFSFRKSSNGWSVGPVIVPRTEGYGAFGSALAARDGWLLATGGSSGLAWLFRVDSSANHAPRFVDKIPLQVVRGRSFVAEIHADDADGNRDLVFDLLQGPAWLSLSNGGGGKATLAGLPDVGSAASQTVQIRVRDSAGAQAVYTYQLSLLSAASLPVLTLEPAGGKLGEGQQIELNAAVSGIGPFNWQWFFDGKPLAGANLSSLVIGEGSPDNSGTYSVSVSNLVGQDDSSGAVIQVQPANRLGGDWPMFGGNSRHTGFQPARLGKHRLVPVWTQQVHPSSPLHRVATGDGKVYATPLYGNAPVVTALDLATGEPVWTHAFNWNYTLNPPAYHNGRVYLQRVNNNSDTQLWALAAGDGGAVWSAPHAAQWDQYESPTVTDAGIWINGGNTGGLYGFDPAGSQRFFRDLEQYDKWTPTVSNNRLFSCVAGDFQEHNPADGNKLWSVNTLSQTDGSKIASISAVSGNTAVVINTTEMVCINLVSRSIRWRHGGTFTGTPAIAGGRVYGIQDKSVVSYSLTDGTPGPVVSIPGTIVSAQPLLLMDYLFVASASNTYMIDRATSTIFQSFTGGGFLSFAQGRLLAAGTDGTLHAWSAATHLMFFAQPPPVVASATAGGSQLDLAEWMVDPDGDETHQWEILENSNPSIFCDIRIDQAGLLQIAYAPYVSGSSTMTVGVRNAAGASAATTISITLPGLPAPSVKINPRIRLNRSTGLYEQKVTVKNLAGRPIAGFDLKVSSLGKRVKLYNGTTDKPGKGRYSYRKPIAAGQSVVVVLKYYSRTRGTIPQPVIKVQLFTPAVTVVTTAKRAAVVSAIVAPALPPFAVSRIDRRADGSVALEFHTEAGRWYRMHFSDDSSYWKSCSNPIQAGAETLEWIDRGPPWTDQLPSEVPRRFYRVERLPP
ncbi:MAG: PQQ-binding-like beta-propeller repeat protein [Luteolibacter sp.]